MFVRFVPTALAAYLAQNGLLRPWKKATTSISPCLAAIVTSTDQFYINFDLPYCKPGDEYASQQLADHGFSKRFQGGAQDGHPHGEPEVLLV